VPKLIYYVGRGFQLLGMGFTCISLLLFGRNGSMAFPMMTAAIGGMWFFVGWLFVRTGIKWKP